MKEGEGKTETKTILFGEGLLVPTLTSEKQTFLRKYREEAHNLHKGEIFIGSFKDGLDILLQATADTEIKTFKELTDLEAQADGFIDAEDAFAGMHKYYPDLTPDTKLGILHYEIVKINGVHSVKANNNHPLYDIKILNHDAQLDNLISKLASQSSAPIIPFNDERSSNIESSEGLLSYKGFLEFYTETGTEGAYWAFQDEKFINEKNWSYEGLHILRNGDELTIFDKEEPEKVIWKGVISLTSPTCFKESVFDLWIHNDQIGTEREIWARWFIDGNPAELTTKAETPNQK